MTEAPVKAGDIVAGKYKVDRVLGMGGMGLVVAALHEELGQKVAIKFLLPQHAQHPEAAARFAREARAAVAIKGEHVCRVIDVGKLENGSPYMVMEYLEGSDLGQIVEQHGSLPVTDAVDYVLQACEALAEAHAAGIVHRDLKPANLFLAHQPDGSASLKVLDFGISKQLPTGSNSEVSLTRTSSMMGSPLYMAPEQMKSSRNVDARTDVWALGAITYELLAATPPFSGETVPEVCANILDTTPEPLFRMHSQVSPELSEVVMRCLERDPSKRWQNVAELAEALGPFGSPLSIVSVQRASRVLAAGAGGVTPAYLSRTPPPVGAMSKSPSKITPSKITPSGTKPQAHFEVAPTVASYNDVPAATASTTAPRRSRAPLWLAGAAALLGAGALVAILASRGTPDTGASPSTATEARNAPAAAEPAASSTPKAMAPAPAAPPEMAVTTAAATTTATPPVASAARVPGPRPKAGAAQPKGKGANVLDTSSFGD